MAGANTGVANVKRQSRFYRWRTRSDTVIKIESNVVLGLEGDIQGTLFRGIGSYTGGMADHIVRTVCQF
jgi:hypothetical protein